MLSALRLGRQEAAMQKRLLVLAVSLLTGCGGCSSPTSSSGSRTITVQQVSGTYDLGILTNPSSCPLLVDAVDIGANVVITQTGDRFAVTRVRPEPLYFTSVEASFSGTVEEKVSSSGVFTGRTLRFDQFHFVMNLVDGGRDQVRALTMPSLELVFLEGDYAGNLNGIVERREGDGRTVTCTAADHEVFLTYHSPF